MTTDIERRETTMTKEMQEYLAQTAQEDKERNKRILDECRKNLIKYKIFPEPEQIMTTLEELNRRVKLLRKANSISAKYGRGWITWSTALEAVLTLGFSKDEAVKILLGK